MVLSLLLSLATVPTALMAAAPVLTPTPFPTGIADPAVNTAYLLDQHDNLIALDLATGKPLWTNPNPTPAKPLLTVNHKLVVLLPSKENSRTARIQLLDPATGERLSQTDPIAFPDWVSIDTDRGHSFAARATLQSNVLSLRWEAHAWYVVGGACPQQGIIDAATHGATGILAIDLRSGQIQTNEVTINTPPPERPNHPDIQPGNNPLPASPPLEDPARAQTSIVGTRFFQIVTNMHTEKTSVTVIEHTLEARDAQTHKRLWQFPLKTTFDSSVLED